MDDYKLLESALEMAGCKPDSFMLEQFATYRRLLLDWNDKINLTAITEPRDVFLKHFVDSAYIAHYADGNLLDIGSGAGFPGVPVKILRPQTKLTLLDSLNKRILFLMTLRDELELDGVECIHARAEEAAHTCMRESFQLVVSRAVAELPALVEYCLPFVKRGGKFISMKGPDVKGEISLAKKAIKLLGGEVLEVKPVKIPFTDIQHSLIIISKIRRTPAKFPRKQVKISKNPII